MQTNRPRWTWFTILGVFYLGLFFQAYYYFHGLESIYDFKVVEGLPAEFQGNDWVVWEDTEQGVIARRVHPLPGYRPTDQSRVLPGDRLEEIDYHPIVSGGVADTITSSAPPGYVFAADVQRPDPYTQSIQKIEGALITNGFWLSFSFNEYGAYWNLSGWIMGLGTFLGTVVLAILLPLVRRTNFRENFPVLLIVILAFAFFCLQLLHHVYLIVESNLSGIGSEKLYILIYTVLLFAYAISYLSFKAETSFRWMILPSVLLSGLYLYSFYDIIYVDRQLKHFHLWLEDHVAIFFLWHLAGGLMFYLAAKGTELERRHWVTLGGMALLALAGVFYFVMPSSAELLHREHAWFGFSLIVFFPVLNASYLRSQFGKISLVVTQTFQYLVTFILGIILYFAISQAFEYLQLNITYRRFLEFIAFLLLMIMARLVYLANESRLTKYFVTSQREKLTTFYSFINRISQYLNPDELNRDLTKEVKTYFSAEPVQLWWAAREGEIAKEIPGIQHPQEIYQELRSNNTFWSKNKEIAAISLAPSLEAELSSSPFALISPLTIKVDEDRYGLLLLGKKKRGVYNLGDLDLLSQLVQQTQLTINVMRRVEREKELVEQTYEANLTALRSQINPHFLFNTLNSITELVHESADLAEQAVEKLAFILRFTTKKSNEQFLQLHDEMDLIRTYLELEQIRFGKRLQTEIEIAPETKDVYVPSFILQTLVENCIKHGISKILYEGSVSIKSYLENDFLVCKVYDNGPGIDLTRIYKSTGLSNSISRLEKLYDLKNLLEFENTGDGTLVTMRIPLPDSPHLSEEARARSQVRKQAN